MCEKLNEPSLKCRSCYDVLCLFACNCIIPFIGYNLSATYYPLVVSEFDTKWYSVDTNMRCLSFRTQILSWIAIHSDESLPKHIVVNHFFFQLCITNQPLFFCHLIWLECWVILRFVYDTWTYNFVIHLFFT